MGVKWLKERHDTNITKMLKQHKRVRKVVLIYIK
jgi:hypothetical protein